MKHIVVTVRDEAGNPVFSREIEYPLDLTVIMVKPAADGGLIIESFEPSETDKHPDTLRQIGSRIADFAG